MAIVAGLLVIVVLLGGAAGLVLTVTAERRAVKVCIRKIIRLLGMMEAEALK